VLFAAETWPFTAATFLMLLIAFVEGLAMVAGATLSGLLHHHLPDPWDNVHGPFDKLLGWLHVGRVPFLVLVVLFLAGFALTGFALNMVAHRFLGIWVPPIVSVPAAFIATLLLSPLFRRRSPEPKQEPPNSVRSTVGARWDTNNLIEGVPRTWVSDDPRKLIEIPPERPRLESVVRSGPILPRRKTLGGYRLKPPAGH